MPSEQINCAVKLAGYLVVFICSAVAVGKLGEVKKELENSGCANWNDGYTPCPLTISFDSLGSQCSTDGETAPCDWVFCIGSLSAVLAFGLAVYHGLWFVDRQPEVAHFGVTEAITAGMMAFLLMSAGAVTTDKFKQVCDSIPDAPTCGTECEAKLDCIAQVLDGFDEFYNRLSATEGTLWTVTVLWLALAAYTYLFTLSAAGGAKDKGDKAYGV
mmetsp:Transcript_11379/g.29026  ORF Transcript_11379/g.29026 Transcript_11379/m.29026 type:complete len:215 (+) Transcript_11379:177-821(+)